MRTYRAGVGILPFRAVRLGQDERTVISVYPPSMPLKCRPVGIAQTGQHNPGRDISVAETPGEICQAEAGGAFDFGAWLTTDELGRVVIAPPGRTPVIAIARGAAKTQGDLLAVEIADRGLTT